VIARNTSFTFKGSATDLRDVASQLGVRYILRGTIQRYEAAGEDAARDRVRVSTELIDAGPGYLVWSDRYDRELRNAPSMQDEIAQSVIAAVFPQFLAAEAQRAHRKEIGSLDAWDNLMRGRWHLWRFSRSENATAQKFLAKTLELDPDHAQALADLAGTHLINALYGWTTATAASLLEAHRLAKKAAAIDDQDAWTYSILGLVDVVLRQYEEGIRRLEAALEINPNFAMGFGFLGLALALNGDTSRAVEMTHKAIRLSPRDPFMAIWYLAQSAAEFVNGNYAGAAEWAKRSVHERPDLPSGYRLLASSSALLQRDDEARAAIKEVLRLIPDQTLTTVKVQLPYRDPRVIELFLEGLAKAGLSE
jgi:tetratricopeptide (TPR) repeat protein